jgi:hypothetical protein
VKPRNARKISKPRLTRIPINPRVCSLMTLLFRMPPALRLLQDHPVQVRDPAQAALDGERASPYSTSAIRPRATARTEQI